MQTFELIRLKTRSLMKSLVDVFIKMSFSFGCIHFDVILSANKSLKIVIYMLIHSMPVDKSFSFPKVVVQLPISETHLEC